MDRLQRWLDEAVDLAEANVAAGGGPFGALVVRDGSVVGRGVNRVVPDHDPTAHAEVVAVRDACRRLGSHELRGCLLVASCEPCPLCRSAAWWARVDRVVHAACAADAAAAGFDDAVLADELRVPAGGEQARLRLEHVAVADAERPFRAWAAAGRPGALLSCGRAPLRAPRPARRRQQFACRSEHRLVVVTRRRRPGGRR